MVFSLLILLACSDTKDVDTEDSQPPFQPTMPISECGLPTYDFLPTDDMGKLISSDFREDLSLSKEVLNTLLAGYDLPLPSPENGVETYYIEYQSQDKGKLTNGTGMIVFPQGVTDAQVIMWMHPTMGFIDECAPTAIGVVGAAYPAVLASLGFIVVAPDYLGMRGWTGESEDLHAYVGSEPTAILSIDSLRALPNLIQNYSKDVTFDPNKIIVWGASEGGFAALTTDRYFPHYAPEYSTIATIASTPVTDPMALGKRSVSLFSPASAGVIGVELTLNQWYETYADPITMLQPEYADIENVLYESCDEFGSIVEVETIEEVFQPEFVDGILADDGSAAPWDCFLKDNDLKSKIPWIRTAPTFIVTAELDDLAWAPPVHNDIPLLCDQGYEIVHQQCADSEHVAGSLDSLGDQWDWLQSRLTGEPLSNVCQVAEPEQCTR